MKKLFIVLGVVVALNLQAQNKLSVGQTDQLEKSADSLACAAHNLLMDCFVQWNEQHYNFAINYIKQSKVMYERLMKDGTAASTELAEILVIMVQSKQSLNESSLMLFDDRFAVTLGNPKDEKMKKKKYNGSVILVPKSIEYKFDNIITKLDVFCE
jgi:hypothetical protein